jgi:hypothetical protein
MSGKLLSSLHVQKPISRRRRARRKGILLERLEERIVFDAAPPVVSLDAPGDV